MLDGITPEVFYKNYTAVIVGTLIVTSVLTFASLASHCEFKRAIRMAATLFVIAVLFAAAKPLIKWVAGEWPESHAGATPTPAASPTHFSSSLSRPARSSPEAEGSSSQTPSPTPTPAPA